MKSNKGKLTLLGLFALAISGIAPTGSMAYSTVVTAKVTGYNIPLSFLLAGVGIFCVAICFASMAKYVSNAGSVYAYNRQAFGEKGGFITGWILTFAYLILLSPQPGLTGNFLDVFLQHFHINFPVSVLAFVMIGVFWIISLLGIKLTSKITLVTEAIALLILVVLSAIILLKAGATGNLTTKPFIPHHNYSGIGQGMIFAILSYAGFEEISTVSVRSKNPKKSIPRTLLWTVILTIIFFAVVTYVQVTGFGIKGIPALVNSPSPLDTLSVRFLGAPMAIVMDLAILLSALASVLGCGNACAYMIYALGKHHYLPSSLGKFDYKLNSPKNAVNVTAILCAIIYALVGVPHGYQYIVTNASTLGTLGLLIVYMMICVGSFFYFFKRDRKHFSWLRHLLIPVIGILILILPFVSNIYPVPAYPANLFPYIIILWIIIGFIVSYFHDKKHHKDVVNFDRKE